MRGNMTIKIRGKGKNKLRLEFEEEGYPLLNLLRQNLWDSEANIEKAGYRKGHTYLDNFKLIIQSKDNDPVEVLKEASANIKDQCDEFSEQLENAV